VLLAVRRSKQAAPPGAIFDALVGEKSIWWISVDGEREPVVLDADRPERISYASPFLWRPNDVIELSIEALGQGSLVHLQHLSDWYIDPLESAAIRHRWGEHIDRDLRDRFDCGGYPSTYEVSLYRGDVDDWTIVDRVLDHSWKAVERLPVIARLNGSSWFPAKRELFPGDVIWAGEMGRHRTSVVCVPEAPPELQERMTMGSEICVPLPEFERRLRPIWMKCLDRIQAAPYHRLDAWPSGTLGTSDSHSSEWRVCSHSS
jgi:hypothetical protein